MERPKVTLGPIAADMILLENGHPRLSHCSIMTLAVAQWIMENEELLNEPATVSRDNELRRKLAAIFKTIGKKYDKFLPRNGFTQWLDHEDTVDWDINDTTWISPIALYFSQNKGENQIDKCLEITCLAVSTICRNTRFIECAKALATSVYYLSFNDFRRELRYYYLLYTFLHSESGYDIPDFSELSLNDINKYKNGDLLPLAISYCLYRHYNILFLLDSLMEKFEHSDLPFRDIPYLYRLIITMSQASSHSNPEDISDAIELNIIDGVEYDVPVELEEFIPTELLEIHNRFVYDFLNSEYSFTIVSRRTFIDKILGRYNVNDYKYICKDGTIIKD